MGRLAIANRLFGEKSWKFEGPSLARTRAAYGAPLEPVDYIHHFCDAPTELLQARIAQRLVESLGHLPGPDALRALSKQHPNVFLPSAHFRALRALEPPTEDEGFDSVEVARAVLPE